MTDAWKTNRVKKTEPKPGKFWCSGCDANLVSAGAKCEVCGDRNGPTKHQKLNAPTTATATGVGG